MVAAAEVTGQLLMVSQSRRYWRNLDALRGADRPARAGSGSSQCSFFKAPHFGGFREEMAYPLLDDMAIHQFDLARDLIGTEPVVGLLRVVQPGLELVRRRRGRRGAVEFADGTRFMFTGSWCSPGLETSWNGSWRVSAAGRHGALGR